MPLDADADVGFTSPADELLDIDEALTRLAAEDPQAARLIQLRYFAGLSIEDAAEVVGISRSTAFVHWSYARVQPQNLTGPGVISSGDRILFLFFRTTRAANPHY